MRWFDLWAVIFPVTATERGALRGSEELACGGAQVLGKAPLSRAVRRAGKRIGCLAVQV